MARVHYTEFELEEAPACANKDGYINFCEVDAERVKRAMRKGKPIPLVSEGSRYVAKLEEKRRKARKGGQMDGEVARKFAKAE